jgi:hypothetical protein
MRNKFLFVCLILLNIFFEAKAQKLVNQKLHPQVDTIKIFPAIGTTLTKDGKHIEEDNAMNEIFLNELKKVFWAQPVYATEYLDREKYELDDSLKTYFIKAIPKFANMSEWVFSDLPLGKSFSKMIADIPGRYFGVIFYQGYFNKQNSEDIASSVAMGVAAGVLGGLLFGGIFAMYATPTESNLNNYFILIDKQENRFLYYNHRIQNGSPIDVENLLTNYHKIMKSYAKSK